MSGLVGGGNLREDIRDAVDAIADISNSTPEINLSEDASAIALRDVVQPFTRARTTNAKTLSEVFDLIYKTLQAANTLDHKTHQIIVTKEYPTISSPLPCFSMRLVSRQPWVANGRREIAPRHMETMQDPDYPGSTLEIEQRRQVNVIEITTWAKTGKVCDDLALWLEDKIYEFLWVYQWCGLGHPIVWLGRGSDVIRFENNQELHGAPQTFQLVTGAITYRREAILRKLVVEAGILNETFFMD